VTLAFSVILFLVSVVVTLGGCALFTNGIEWLGKRLKVPPGAVGSIFAAVGTTLPETSIPIVAILFGADQERIEVGLGAILGAPFLLSTLVLPILAGLLLLYAWMGRRAATFHLNYREVRVDLLFFLVAYSLAVACTVIPFRVVHYAVAALLITMYIAYIYIKFSGQQEGETMVEPLFFARRALAPPYFRIGLQAIIGLVALAGGAYLFVTAAEVISAQLGVSPLLLSLLIAPLATELPEMSNSFLWLYQRKDTLAVGNVTGAMVFQGTFPVSIGLVGTTWHLGPSGLVTMGLSLAAVGLSFVQLLWGGQWRPWLLGAMALLYAGFMVYVTK
jgi:cation:H+ antiporter